MPRREPASKEKSIEQMLIDGEKIEIFNRKVLPELDPLDRLVILALLEGKRSVKISGPFFKVLASHARHAAKTLIITRPGIRKGILEVTTFEQALAVLQSKSK